MTPEEFAQEYLRAANLKTLGDSETTLERVDTTGISGSLAAFDPVGNLAWAQRLAGTWSPDARLVRLTVQEMTASGVLDVSDHGVAKVEYCSLPPHAAQRGARRRRSRPGRSSAPSS